ncbi:hypothetical protein C1646_707673 [Rhizophagus diaphanus]|nr:hypothetical protein C1646_707673 [Rhizophagus diaphanus] [Rhizophagus sp. MUCL 43196]
MAILFILFSSEISLIVSLLRAVFSLEYFESYLVDFCCILISFISFSFLLLVIISISLELSLFVLINLKQESAINVFPSESASEIAKDQLITSVLIPISFRNSHSKLVGIAIIS